MHHLAQLSCFCLNQMERGCVCSPSVEQMCKLLLGGKSRNGSIKEIHPLLFIHADCLDY